MRLFIVILLMLFLILAIVTVVPAQSYHQKYGKLKDKPATYQAHTRGYKNVEFIRKLNQRKQYRQHRKNVRRGESKVKPSPLYFRSAK